jgi:protoporphyrinogen oxidase
MKIAIIGAGVGGMSAGWDLIKAGHDVTIIEAADYVGGLAAGLKEPHWDWSVEHFYHHWFTSDDHMYGMLEELGIRDKVVIKQPKTVSYYNGKFYPLDSPLAALTFPGFSFIDMVRFGLVTAYLRYLTPWQPLEKHTAVSWIRKYYGKRLYDVLLQPLLFGKFGPHYEEVNMAWFWARFKARTTKLATFEGGFQAFADAFAEALQQRGATLRLSSPVESIKQVENGIEVRTSSGTEIYDRVLATISPGLLARMAPGLSEDYLKGLLSLKSMGAVVMIMSLKHKLSNDGYYWFNLPKSAGFPYLALVEHTNFLSPEEFGGDHIIYCGDYLPAGHEYFDLSNEALLDRFAPGLKRVNPDFQTDWVKDFWVFKTSYAQPVPLVNHSQNIPSLQTPIPGLFFASMSQVYPWDRGTNYAVQIGRQAARKMISEL